ncbi:MAG: GNAT family N-acetyltransferase [Desulfobacteraceae bacterium]|nr:MAG: GNAT family N-acetyltransferase [Desulfobacteraceae bacterium]
MKKKFTFFNPGKLIADDLELILTKKSPADPVKGYVPEYEFEMRQIGKPTAIGSIRLRIGSAPKLRYPGHIGFEVNENYRGHRYAAQSCQLIFSLARAHGLSAVWLTVDPKNIPSRRTCEMVGGKYIETVRVSKAHEMYDQGKRFLRRYRISL